MLKKIKSMFVVLASLMMMALTHHVSAQDSTRWIHKNNERIDSIQTIKAQLKKDQNNLSDLKSERDQSKDKAKAAQEVERDASTAAREAKMAYRTEKRAQKARKQADKQLKKAEHAKAVSDNN